MGVDAGLYMYDVVVETFTFAISSTGEFLFYHTTIPEQLSHDALFGTITSLFGTVTSHYTAS